MAPGKSARWAGRNRLNEKRKYRKRNTVLTERRMLISWDKKHFLVFSHVVKICSDIRNSEMRSIWNISAAGMFLKFIGLSGICTSSTYALFCLKRCAQISTKCIIFPTYCCRKRWKYLVRCPEINSAINPASIKSKSSTSINCFQFIINLCLDFPSIYWYLFYFAFLFVKVLYILHS